MQTKQIGCKQKRSDANKKLSNNYAHRPSFSPSRLQDHNLKFVGRYQWQCQLAQARACIVTGFGFLFVSDLFCLHPIFLFASYLFCFNPIFFVCSKPFFTALTLVGHRAPAGPGQSPSGGPGGKAPGSSWNFAFLVAENCLKYQRILQFREDSQIDISTHNVKWMLSPDPPPPLSITSTDKNRYF